MPGVHSDRKSPLVRTESWTLHLVWIQTAFNRTSVYWFKPKLGNIPPLPPHGSMRPKHKYRFKANYTAKEKVWGLTEGPGFTSLTWITEWWVDIQTDPLGAHLQQMSNKLMFLCSSVKGLSKSHRFPTVHLELQHNAFEFIHHSLLEITNEAESLLCQSKNPFYWRDHLFS